MVKQLTLITVLFIAIATNTGCSYSKKMDRFIAEQYNDELPKQRIKKQSNITVVSNITTEAAISKTVHSTSKWVPLLFYWQWEDRETCHLNPAIGVNNFSTAINSFAEKSLGTKLNGQALELTVEQVPSAFAIVDKAHLVWVIYAVGWDKVYIEPDHKDLIVSYKLVQDSNTLKTGKISIKNMEENKKIRYFQSWKSAVTEYLEEYNMGITAMTKSFINKLGTEL